MAEDNNQYQDILNRAQKLRESGALNSSELTTVALLIQAIYAMGVDISKLIAAWRNDGVQDEQAGAQGETSQMVFPFMRDNGDEPPV